MGIYPLANGPIPAFPPSLSFLKAPRGCRWPSVNWVRTPSSTPEPRWSLPITVRLALTNHSSGHGQVPVTVSSQWEWLNADAYLSLETTRESYLQTLCARRWIPLFPDQKQQSELWPVQDGLLLNKIPLTRLAAAGLSFRSVK